MSKCYSCKYRRNVPGSAHSACTFVENPLIHYYIMVQTKGVYPVTVNDKPLVELNPHGMKNGWAEWPVNFDPVWVDCQIPDIKDGNIVS